MTRQYPARATDPSADLPRSSPFSVWSTCAKNYNYTAHAQEVALQYAQNDQLAPLLVSNEVLLLQCGQHVLQNKIILRMRKRLLYNAHRMISWPLCWSAMKFSFFSVVNMCYKIRLYCACARGCFTMRTEWSAGPSAGPPWSSPSSVWSTCATK